MTRSQRIALARFGYRVERAFDRALESTTDAQWAAIYPLRRCFEAMDEPDAPEIVTGGNYGLPCA